jgi:hypothetical protein
MLTDVHDCMFLGHHIDSLVLIGAHRPYKKLLIFSFVEVRYLFLLDYVLMVGNIDYLLN